MYVVLYPERVTTLREERRMTKRDLAAAAKVSTTTARNAERAGPDQDGEKDSGGPWGQPAPGPRSPGASAVGTLTGPGYPSNPGLIRAPP